MPSAAQLTMPSLALRSIVPGVEPIDLATLTADHSLVIYFFVGNGSDDAVRARAFHDRFFEFADLDHMIVGISTQAPEPQRDWAVRENVHQYLGSDTGYLFANELGLATRKVDHTKVYEFQMLVVRNGSVKKLFYPGDREDTMRVLTWLVKDRYTTP